MDVSFFRRGIKLPRKDTFGPIEEIDEPSEVALLLRQAAGPPCSPVVEVGEQVAVGQRVAEGSGVVADLHASISGVIKNFDKYRLPDGSNSDAIIIEGDGEKGKRIKIERIEPSECDPRELLERIRRAGIVRSGSEVKSLAAVIEEAISREDSKTRSSVKYLVVRCCDPDPFVGTLAAITAGLDTDVDDLRLGIEALERIIEPEKVCLVLGKKQSAPHIERFAEEHKYKLARLDDSYYPSLADSLMARAVTHKEPDISAGGVHKSGTLIVDINTVIDVCLAVRDRKPVIEEMLTVSGPNGTRVVKARIGTSLGAIASVTGQSRAIGKIVIGGPMRGQAHHTLNFPLGKGVEGVTLFGPDEVTRAVNSPCLSCGLCSEVCPMRLTPGLLSRYCEFGQWETAARAHLFHCIECGACAYVCPAGRSMVQFMIQGKAESRAMHGRRSNG